MGTDYRSQAPVALTFDDGPDPIWTPLVVDALARAHARATFFVVAQRAARYASLISSMRNKGHDVAFHCALHVRHDAMTRRETLTKEYLRGEASREDLPIESKAWYEENSVKLRLLTSIVAIDRERQIVIT